MESIPKHYEFTYNTLQYNNHGEIVAKTRNIYHQRGKDINHENKNLSIKMGELERIFPETSYMVVFRNITYSRTTQPYKIYSGPVEQVNFRGTFLTLNEFQLIQAECLGSASNQKFPKFNKYVNPDDIFNYYYVFFLRPLNKL